MLKRFSAKQYRNVEADGLEFRRVTVLVGPNNGGKSNLIDAIRFYADVCTHEGKGSAFQALIERRGYGDVLRRSIQPPGTIEMKWEHDVGPHRNLVLDIAFRVAHTERFPAGFQVVRDVTTVVDPASDRRWERRFDGAKKGSFQEHYKGKPDGRVETKSSSMDTSDFIFHQARLTEEMWDGFDEPTFVIQENDFPILGDKDWLINELSCQRYLVGSGLAPRQIAASAKRNLSILTLDSTGSELVNVLNNLERRHNDFLDPFAERLREMLSGLEKMRIDDISDQYKSLKLKIDGSWFRLDELSEGTLKIMALGLLLFTPEKASLLSIDEPELNLHPAWLRVLGKWILGAKGADQVLISTHSPDLLDAFTEGFRKGEVALIVCDPKKGFHNIEPAALDGFFKEGWDLGDLYRVGEPALGGWPW